MTAASLNRGQRSPSASPFLRTGLTGRHPHRGAAILIEATRQGGFPDGPGWASRDGLQFHLEGYGEGDPGRGRASQPLKSAMFASSPDRLPMEATATFSSWAFKAELDAMHRRDSSSNPSASPPVPSIWDGIPSIAAEPGSQMALSHVIQASSVAEHPRYPNQPTANQPDVLPFDSEGLASGGGSIVALTEYRSAHSEVSWQENAAFLVDEGEIREQ